MRNWHLYLVCLELLVVDSKPLDGMPDGGVISIAAPHGKDGIHVEVVVEVEVTSAAMSR